MIGIHIYKHNEHDKKSLKNKTLKDAIENEIKYASKFNIELNTFQIFIK